MKIGAQLYTVRDFAKNLDDFSNTLQKIADIGYTTVQVSGTCEYEPEWLRDQLKKTGLSCVITHCPTDKIAAEPQKMADNHKIFDCSNIGIGWYKVQDDGVDAFYNRFIGASKIYKQNNMRLCYHNHDLEFAKLGDSTILEQLANKFNPDELCFTLDTYWVQAGGGDPIQWINRLKGRIPCVHLKDMAYERKMMVVGEGNMNFDGILYACEGAGAQYLLVEQDNCNGEDPFDCLKRSYEYLKSKGLN